MAMPFVLLFLFLALPILELYVIIQVGQAIGFAPTLLLLILDGIAGAALARSQGRNAWARFNRALAEGRVPAKETLDGGMIILGGALLLAPGFITDIFGFAAADPADSCAAAWPRRAARSPARELCLDRRRPTAAVRPGSNGRGASVTLL